ncbi:alpha-ketoglutarate-dependent dioxygenase AlkB [Leptolyngbya sp. FACHB-541]|uniref:alpha-ketoglutarate-dependent dioxygenase AlkB n=1 Tax=Leptolyngbya sp. FACHB-541 TaxID=2692810 RepID=UPI00168866DE|nr:alpha-ketoglutarate-dependent dioxygenase AlkB [Leptolyngbya sp. FACHB-541]MBD1995169.1 alpha-ketoglutarate-dependent dioxygenase AlkB [Leptolyngbya sp. FACHB-541]
MNQLDLIPRSQEQIAPGVWHVPDWLPIDQQNAVLTLLRHCTRKGWYTPKMLNGTPMKHPIACIGLQWRPYEYYEARVPVPGEFILMAVQALIDTNLQRYLPFTPDTGIVNMFPLGSSLGLHQDKSEDQPLIDAGSPIVTVSLGDSGMFRLGNVAHRDPPYKDIELRSGDLLVMSGHSRLAYHGITEILPNTCPADLEMQSPGRISLTMRRAKEE